MCGILGWIDPSLADMKAARQAARPALEGLARRGPDGSGIACGPRWLLGHTRLAILDLTDRAQEPMTDGHGGWLVYNGEIYNFQELRAELSARGVTFRSTGDAEVVLHAMREWGPACLGRLRGMFAFAWLDEQRREMVLARDRYGVKPLAYEATRTGFRFASDLFGLRALPGAASCVDAEAAFLYMALGYVPAPLTILEGVRKVRPGHYLRVGWSDDHVGVIGEYAYWSMAEIPPADGQAMTDCSRVVGEYEARIGEAVRSRLVSDVPVGMLLSGGIDSTLVMAMCREQPGADVPSFTMGFDDPAADEAPFARAVAAHLGGAHTEFQIDEKDVLAVWRDLWSVYDEPFADSSALPMVALCRGVVLFVKVALTGDGGDEAFCGYPWHRALDRVNGFGGLPWVLRRSAGLLAAKSIPALRYKGWVYAQRGRVAQWSVLRTGLTDEAARELPVVGAEDLPPLSAYFAEWSKPLANVCDPLDWACRMDLVTYLPDDLMVKADRAGMSVGLELREPLLDHELTTWCLQRPIAERYDRARRTAKLPTRYALAKRMPHRLFDRPKQGFTPPLDRWLDGPLRPVVEDAFERLARGELFPLELPPDVRDGRAYAATVGDRHRQVLWRVVCFSEWARSVAATRARVE